METSTRPKTGVLSRSILADGHCEDPTWSVGRRKGAWERRAPLAVLSERGGHPVLLENGHPYNRQEHWL